MASTEDVKKLRDTTGVSIMQCKQALDEADGEVGEALLILRKRGAGIAAKKADRDLAAGAVSAYVHANKAVGAMVVLRSETDFVAKNDEFVALAYDIAMHVAAANPTYIRREDIDESTMRVIRDMFEKEVADKPEQLRAQILEGKVGAYLKGIVLMEQSFIKDPERSVKDLVDGAVQKFGERIEIGQMVRFGV